jgi:hypothetical protein
MLADQLLTRFECLHARGYTHGSVKLANFTIGDKQRVNSCCYMIDFGRSKKYIDTKGVHIDVHSYSSTMQGSFFSINACEGGAQSRRDDMQSLGYMLMYFLRGSLPWAGGLRGHSKQNRVRSLHVKKDTSAKQLCRGYPQEFREYFAHIASLGFEDRPDYAHLRGLFRALFEQQGFADDGMYDWSGPAPVGTARTSTAAISSADTTSNTAAAVDGASTAAVPASDTTTPTAAAVDGASTAAVPAADTTSNTAAAVDGASTAAGLAADTTSNTAAAVDGASTAAVPAADTTSNTAAAVDGASTAAGLAADTTTPTATAVDGASTAAGLAADTTTPTAAAAIDGASIAAVICAETTAPSAAAAIDGASPCAVIGAETTAPSAALTAGCTTATATAAAAATAAAVAVAAAAVVAPPTSTVTNPVVEVTMAAAVVATAFSTVSDPVVDASGPS